MDALLRELQQRMRARRIPGASLRVFVGSDQRFGCELGVRDLETRQALLSTHRFRVGCLTKPLMAHAVLAMAEAGQVQLDDPVCRFIPELERHAIFSPTLAHLLSHSSGLPRGDYFSETIDASSRLKRIAQTPLLFEPGTTYKYSNWGYFLLGVVISRVSGMKAEDVVHAQVFRPLDMQRTNFANEEGAEPADLATGYWKGWRFGAPDLSTPSRHHLHVGLDNYSGGVVSCTDDFQRWLLAMASAEVDDHVESSSRAVAREMLRLRRRKSGKKHATFGWFARRFRNEMLYYFPGSSAGFSGFMFVIPSQRAGGIALSNHTTCSNELKEMVYHAYRALRGGEACVPFGRGSSSFELTLRNEHNQPLRLSKGASEHAELVEGDQRIDLYPHSKHTYFMLNGTQRRRMLRIVRNRGRIDRVCIGERTLYPAYRRRQPTGRAAEAWKALTGRYGYEPFGLVEVFLRENRLYLSYGAVYETPLKSVSELCFTQEAGPFRLELVEFQRKPIAGEIKGFLMNGMFFERSIITPAVDEANVDHTGGLTQHHTLEARVVAPLNW